MADDGELILLALYGAFSMHKICDSETSVFSTEVSIILLRALWKLNAIIIGFR